jgi:hypothetical protein
MKPLLTCLLLAASSMAYAERFETALVAGYTTAGGLEPKALGITDLRLAGGFTWGATATYFVAPRWGIEGSWTRQQSALEIGTADGDARMFDVDVDRFYGSLVWQLAQASPIRPFVAGGLGASVFRAANLQDETKLSFSVASGVRWMPAPRAGARLQVRYAPTLLGDSGSGYCDPFGFCQDWLHQVEITGGVVVRF